MFSHFSTFPFFSFFNVFHFLKLRGGMFSQHMGLEGVFPYLGMGVGGYVAPFWGWVFWGWGGIPIGPVGPSSLVTPEQLP